MTFSRRQFLGAGSAAAAGFWGLRTLLEDGLADRRTPGYGPLFPDADGLLDVPRGFHTVVVSRTGQTMSDGLLVPGAPDGMAAFSGPGGSTRVVRNHELTPGTPSIGPFGDRNALLGRTDRAALYDFGRGLAPGLGGTTTFVYDPVSRKTISQSLSLGGTIRNCAGGSTPWGSWLSCEETVQRARGTIERDHGYVFEVPSGVDRTEPVALKAMGRFNHEAAAVDPVSGCVYLTEDRGSRRPRRPEEAGLGLFYRFVPELRGRLSAGGKLEALQVRGRPGVDTSNWRGRAFTPGRPVEVEWVDLDRVDSPDDDLRYRGRERGAAGFTRGEGIWAGADGLYFCCTDGGLREKGQIWRYRPSPVEGGPGESHAAGTLELFVEPDTGTLLENCDNLTVAPWGDLIVCEDGPGGNRLVGVTPAGKLYRLAHNAFNSSELAGVCFAPDASALFVNIQWPGITIAVHPPTGRWTAPQAV